MVVANIWNIWQSIKHTASHKVNWEMKCTTSSGWGSRLATLIKSKDKPIYMAVTTRYLSISKSRTIFPLTYTLNITVSLSLSSP